jgi:hypothetical protein
MTSPDNPKNPLATVDGARAAIARLNAELVAATTLPETIKVSVMADTLRTALRGLKASLDIQNDVAEGYVLARRRVGEMLAEMEKNQGGRPSEEKPLLDPEGLFPTLAELGISYNFSSECQRLARVKPEMLAEYFALCRAGDEQVEPVEGVAQYRRPTLITAAGLLIYDLQLRGMTAEKRDAAKAEQEVKDAQSEAERVSGWLRPPWAMLMKPSGTRRRLMWSGPSPLRLSRRRR